MISGIPRFLLAVAVLLLPAAIKSETRVADQVGYNPPPAECEYPCLPPPTATANCPPPPPPPASSGYYPPPATAGYYPPPASTGYYPPPETAGYSPPFYPYTPPPPFEFLPAPPPPNPILSWFPFYYQHPPPPRSQSSPGRSSKPMAMILQLILLGFLLV